MTKKKNKKNKKRIYIYLLSLISLFIVITISGVFYTYIVIKNLPSLDQFETRKVSESTKIYDRTGEILLYEIFGEEKRTIISFNEIPKKLKEATLAIEDDDFYNQPALDWKAIIRAFITNLKQGRIAQGGSTITQQLVKNVFLTPEKTITRKIKELILAIQLESKYTKEEIFSAYLNQIPYGSNAYGIQAASQTFFNKDINDLNLSEIAILAGLPQAPSYYSPWGYHIDELFNRRDYVLKRMNKLGFITKEELENAKKTEIKFAPQNIGLIKAPHFSLEVKKQLIDKYGEELILNGGLKVITTLDWDIQKIAEKVIKEGAIENEKLYGGKNAALLTQDPKTGQILSMVGSRDYFDEKINGKFNVVTQGLRQPGSTLKPFAFLTAFEKGYQPKTIIYDTETEFVSKDPNCPAEITPESDNNPTCFNPENFDGLFRGPVSMEEGLSQSINIPSVKTLYLAGFDNTLDTLNKFGISTLTERWRYGLSLVLGGGEVYLSELINAYATLSQEGVKHDQKYILKIEKPNGEIIEKYEDNKKQIFNKENVKQINQILSDINLRSGLFHGSLSMTIFPGREVALKTGTTNDYKDAWAIGYTPYITFGVWAGNNNNTSMHKHGSSLLAAVPMWSKFLNEVFEIKNYPKEIFNRPESINITNKPMLNGQPIFYPIIEGETYPQIHNILHWINKDNPLEDPPLQPEKDSQYSNWETSVLNWGKKNLDNFNQYNKPLPDNVDFNKITKTENSIIQFKTPKNGDYINSPFIIQINISSLYKIQKIELYLNNKLIQQMNINNRNYNYYYYLTEELKEQNSLKIKTIDENNTIKEKSIVIFK
jgi:1A family penicillin-binding protein